MNNSKYLNPFLLPQQRAGSPLACFIKGNHDYLYNIESLLTIKQGSFDPCGDLGPMPQGWEVAKDLEGRTYFMNHQTRTTQWEDPR